MKALNTSNSVRVFNNLKENALNIKHTTNRAKTSTSKTWKESQLLKPDFKE